MNSTVRLFLYCVLGYALVALIAIVAGCSKRSIPSDAPKPPLFAWTLATGESMLPTFPQSAYIEVIIGIPYSQLKPGTSVLFWDYTQDKPVIIHHRLIQKQGGNWIAQGDNPKTNPKADRPWVTQDNYIGVTTGRHTQLLQTPAIVERK